MADQKDESKREDAGPEEEEAPNPRKPDASGRADQPNTSVPQDTPNTSVPQDEK